MNSAPLIHYIATINRDPQLWLLLALAVPRFGRYLLKNPWLMTEFQDLFIEETHGDECIEWKLFGKLHRNHDLPAIIWLDGSLSWHRHGMLHRNNGPAVVRKSGALFWYHNDKMKRYCFGPALISSDGIENCRKIK